MKQMKMLIMNIGHQSILDGGADTCVLGQG
jgi:hypothetical protein